MRGATLAATLGVALLAGCDGTGERAHRDGADGPLGPGPVTVEVELGHSRFAPDRLTVVEGTTVHFLVRISDPVDHELIVGPDVVHRRHETGTDPEHGRPPRRGLGAGGGGAGDDLRLRRPRGAAHRLPSARHQEYGMFGEVEVLQP